MSHRITRRASVLFAALALLTSACAASPPAPPATDSASGASSIAAVNSPPSSAAVDSAGRAATNSPGTATGTVATSSPSNTPSSSAADFPVTIKSGGTTVTLTRPPVHIVSLSASATEMLFAIGAGSQVKAVDSTSDYPSSAPRTTLSAYQLNPESVAGYDPDLVVESGLTSAQVTQLQKLGLPVLNLPSAVDLGQSYDEIAQLGKATGHGPGAAAVVAGMKQRIAAIVAATPQPPAGTRYYYELDQTYYSVTSATFIGQLLELLHLTSIADAAAGAAAAGGYPQLSAESILAANPAYVFLADTKCCGQTPKTVAKRPGWSSLAAVRGGRVVGLDDDIASRWGPRVVDLLSTVAAAVRAHPVTS